MFNLNEANESTGSSVNYQKVGIYDNVKVTEVILAKTGLNQVPYMELKTVGEDGAVGKSNKMFLSTDVKPGKQTSAWAITARNILDLIVNTHNITRDEAKAIQLVNPAETNPEKAQADLVNKVASLLVGKPFRAKFRGEEGTKPGVIWVSLDLTESMNVPKDQSMLRFDPARDIKKLIVPTATAATTTNDLPF
jgi:hypothetical protein